MNNQRKRFNNVELVKIQFDTSNNIQQFPLQLPAFSCFSALQCILQKHSKGTQNIIL